MTATALTSQFGVASFDGRQMGQGISHLHSVGLLVDEQFLGVVKPGEAAGRAPLSPCAAELELRCHLSGHWIYLYPTGGPL